VVGRGFKLIDVHVFHLRCTKILLVVVVVEWKGSEWYDRVKRGDGTLTFNFGRQVGLHKLDQLWLFAA